MSGNKLNIEILANKLIIRLLLYNEEKTTVRCANKEQAKKLCTLVKNKINSLMKQEKGDSLR
jgi:hypothetical protein